MKMPFQSLSAESQEQLYNEFYRLVYRIVYFITNDHASTEDIIQEAFLRAIANPPQWGTEEQLMSWIKTVTRNTTYIFLRKHQKLRDELTTEDVDIDESLTPGFFDHSLENEVELRLMKEAIQQYINRLKPNYRAVLELRLQHHSYKEMAEILGVTEGIVRQRLARAREGVKNKLATDWSVGP